MLSVIVYGRNDNHGYNLPKRAAISLNCIAEVLTAPGDEIIFVDYNTPDDLPTFPEAIADTLTGRAKKLLRILRVRPRQHERFRHKTQLVAFEPVARNVAVRRSNPDNRWVLSTNTDMIFVPRRATSLSDIITPLPDAYYHLARFEIPEPLWETLDRQYPAAMIDAVRAWGEEFHLNDIAYCPPDYPQIKYDAPGDFQLVLRSDLWRVNGFDESMVLHLHVDSNLAVRLALLPRAIGEVIDQLYGYHCDHTRQLTPSHRHDVRENDPQKFLADVSSPQITEQAQSWGLADEKVEEVTVDTTSRLFLASLRGAITKPLVEPTLFEYYGGVDERPDYTAEHVLPFLAGTFAGYSRDVTLGWFGSKRTLLQQFAEFWKVMGFTKQIIVFDEARWLGPDLPSNCTWASLEALNERSEVFTFDFGIAQPDGVGVLHSDDIIDAVAVAFQRIIGRERLRVVRDHKAPRPIIGVNTNITHQVRMMFGEDVAATKAPPSTRVRVGYVTRARDCMPALIAGEAGIRVPASPHVRNPVIHAKAGVAGTLSYGPYFALLPGGYEVTYEFQIERAARGSSFRIDVATLRGQRILAQQHIKPYAHMRNSHNERERQKVPLTCVLPFNVTSDATEGDKESVEFRVWSPGTISFSLVALSLRQSVPV